MAAINKKHITKHLETLANQVVDAELVDGEVIEFTRAERLAELIWKKALGHIEEIPDPKNAEEKITKIHPPATWAITHILDRLEGRVKPTDAPNENVGAIGKRISDISNREKLNGLADAAVGADSEGTVPGHSGDLDGPDHELEGSEEPGSEPPVA